MPVAALTAGATLGAAAIGSSAASKAAKAQSNAEAQQLAFQKQVYGDATSNLTPTITAGNAAGTELSGLLGTGGNPSASQDAFTKYLNSTNYKFLLNQGEQGIQYANAPAFNSGATAKALDTYATGQAGNALSGYEALLTGQQGLGVTAGSALAGVGTNISQQQSASTNAAAAASGAASINNGNSWASALRGLSNQTSSYGNLSPGNLNTAFGGLFTGGSSSPFSGGNASGNPFDPPN